MPNLADNSSANTGTATIIGGLSQGSAGDLCGGSLIGAGNSKNGDYVNTDWALNLNSPWTISFRTSNITPPLPCSTCLVISMRASSAALPTGWPPQQLDSAWSLCGRNGIRWGRGGSHHDYFVYDFVTSDIKAYVNGVFVVTPWPRRALLSSYRAV